MSSKKKPMRFRFGLSKKLLLSILLLTALICAVSTFIGYYQYEHTIRKLYNDHGYQIGDVILANIDHDQVAKYTQTWTEDEHYAEISDFIRSVAENTNVAWIYMVTVNEDHTIRYVFDSTGTPLGSLDPIGGYFDEVWDSYTQGTRPKSYLIRKSPKYGYLSSSLLPVKDSQGKTVALLLVDVFMPVIISTLNSYIFNMILASLGVLAIFSAVYWFILRRNAVKPLVRIRDNVTEFAQNETVTTTSLEGIRTRDEIQELSESITHMESDIRNYIENIRVITADKERIGTELNVATQIQADMLPRIFPPFPDRKELDIYATMNPAKEVGGDFYDFFFVDDNHLCMVMADVSGKGVPAALFMVIAKTLIKNRALLGESPTQILSSVNSQLCDGNEAEMFVTVWIGILDLSTGKGLAANAGHEHPVIRRAGGQYELVVYRHSPVVAVMDGIRFREHEFEMHPGDSLFVYTDGVPEATDARDELFGTDRMLAAMNRDPDADPETLLGNVRQAIDAFVGEAPQFDDITMLGMRYHGPASGQEKPQPQESAESSE
ncbi:MAG: SpoIIE family protein phosphatase [Clostridia bacterium]|nr:SpoIIE family protein phosphatase [Clostridia bacterium]